MDIGKGNNSLFNSSDTKNGTDPQTEKWSFEFSVTLACIMSVSAFCTVVGNCMVLMVIIRHRGMRTRTNLFLLNLAITDLLVGLFVEPFSITTLIQNDWVFGVALCKITGWMNGFCLITSFHTLMYISIHKYFSIVRPLSNPLKLNYIIIMMVSAWLWAAVCSTLNVLVLVVEYKPGTSQCGPRYPSYSEPITIIIHYLVQLTVIIIPAIIMVFCYYRMFVEIKNHSQRLRTNSTVEEDFILSQQKKVTVTLFIVLATFIMMALPYHIYATYTTLSSKKTGFPNYINPLAYMFLFLSSMCNPIIYAFRSPAFREGYKEILCQTPNYVISDEFEQVPRTRRLSSFISSFRTGLGSGTNNSIHCADDKPLTTKLTGAGETTGAGEKQVKAKFTRQKSLFELLRSTRQSSAQSVVHRNGDIIIMKGGKIVSVRRGGEGSPNLDQFRTFQAKDNNRSLTAGLASARPVMFGFVYNRVANDKNFIASQESHEISEITTDIHSQPLLKQNTVNPIDVEASSFAYNGKNKSLYKITTEKGVNVDYTEEKYSQSMKIHNTFNGQSKFSSSDISLSSGGSLDGNSFLKTTEQGFSDSEISEIKLGNLKSRNKPPCLVTRSSDNSTTTVTSFHPEGVVIHVGEDDDILSVMPLTPHTREYLAKSEVNLSPTTPGHIQEEAFVFKPLHLSQSSENFLKKKPPVIQRLPSLEFLDPPVHLWRSHSNISMHSCARRSRWRSKSPKTRDRSQSPDIWSSSKSSHLQSTFLSRNKVTQM